MRRSGHHIMLAVPTRGQIQWQTVTALEAARDYTPSLRPILYQEGNLSVALTRNRIVKRFLDTDCTTLAMVDDDIAPPVNFLELIDPFIPEFGMVAMPHPTTLPMSETSQTSQVGSTGRMILTAYNRVDGGVSVARLDPGINRVDAVATGCIVISRGALEELGPAPFRIENDPDAEFTSDDFLFCDDLRESGFLVGCYWNGEPVDHFRTASLAPILEVQMRQPAMAERSN